MRFDVTFRELDRKRSAESFWKENAVVSWSGKAGVSRGR